MSDQPHTSGISSEVVRSEATYSEAAQSEVANSEAAHYDVAIVGASLAGCSAAILLARTGARVALVEKSPDPQTFKRVCSHYIQSSAIPALERLGLLEPMMQAGAVRSRIHVWTRWGWVTSPNKSTVASGVNLRRERLDPIVRELAAGTPGVELILGHTVRELLRDGEQICGLRARDTHGQTIELRTRLVVGADGRDSRVAKLAGVPTKVASNARFAYGGYYEGPLPARVPTAALWMLDPDMASAFPTDDGLMFYGVMPSKERLPEFRGDPAAALEKFVASIPDAPPIAQSRLVGEVTGKIDMTNVINRPTAPGVALVGDAASALDPLWGVGCGFAFQSSEWLADSVAAALGGTESMEVGLRRYRRRHTRYLRGHTLMMLDYTKGRKFNAAEHMLFSAASYDERTRRVFEAFASRNIGPVRAAATAVPLGVLANARNSCSRRGGSRTRSTPVTTMGQD